MRRLRIYSFDPALAAQYDLAGMSGVTIEVPWEDDLKPGPVGEHVEVIDVDPGSDVAYPGRPEIAGAACDPLGFRLLALRQPVAPKQVLKALFEQN